MDAASRPSCTLYQGDCLEVMPALTAGSVAMVFADLPYKILHHAWDSDVSLEKLWAALDHTCLENACIVFSATQRFAVELICAQSKRFRYDLVYEKGNATGFLNAKRQPMRAHELLLIFYKKQPTYNPQITIAQKRWSGGRNGTEAANYKGFTREAKRGGTNRQPRSVLVEMSEACRGRVHPTQKPVALLEWLIATYTNKGDTVLDPVFGSCTTGVACARLGRHFIGIEKDADYFRIGTERVNAERANLGLAPAEVLV